MLRCKMPNSLLTIKDLHLKFDLFEGVSHVLNGVDLFIERGERVAIVGESGCGKSTAVRAILGLLSGRNVSLSGSIQFSGSELIHNTNQKLWRDIRSRRISMIFQDPTAALNPVFSVRDQMVNVIRRGSKIRSKKEALDLAKKNKEKLFAVNVSFEKIDILKEIPIDNFDVMISNPPYITKEEINFLDKDVRNFEPIIALTDHKDGLTFYRRFADIALDVVKSGGWIILEVGQKSHPEKAKTIFNKMGFNNVKLINDYNGDNRILLIQV